MNITARVTPIENEKIKGLATITLGEQYAIGSILIKDGQNGLFVDYPQRKNSEGNYESIAFPITADFREQLNTAIMEAYHSGEEQKVGNEQKDVNLKVSMTKLEDGTNIKALTSVSLDNSFVIKNIKVLEGKNGVFVQMPSYKNKSGEFKDIAFPITAEAREALNTAVLNQYNKNTQTIGNIAYKDLGDKSDLYYTAKYTGENAQKLEAALTAKNIPFSGKIDGENTTFVVNKKDTEALQTVQKELFTASPVRK